VPGPRPDPPHISIVVPVLDEEDCVEELARRVRDAMDGSDARYEILFVDDGSRDRTPERIAELHKADPATVRTIRFTRSFGHQAALAAGLRHARGDAVVTMDGDLQHPPEFLPTLIDAWRGGADVVNTVRRAVDAFNGLEERSIYARGLIPWLGFPDARVEYEVGDRYAGRSKYGLWPMLRLALDGIFSFSVLPLRLITILGLVTTLFGVGFGIFALLAQLTGGVVASGWTSVVVLILVFGGVQLLSVGILSEYVGRVYAEVKRRPRYVIESQSELDSP
jgi:dolichol-phosphate mannosyltransferase